ncbi:MAG: hypothetical protein ACYTHN_21940 [Planctomycetota bacterium]
MDNEEKKPDGRWRTPFNWPGNPRLQKVEMALFTLLFLFLCAALAFRGILFLRDGKAVFPLLGVTLPEPFGIFAGVFYLLLSGGIALGTLAMVIKFR